jgi:hypothetical protein
LSHHHCRASMLAFGRRTTPPVTGFLFESGSSQKPPVFD